LDNALCDSVFNDNEGVAMAVIIRLTSAYSISAYH